MNVLTVAVIALSVLAALLVYVLARTGRLLGEIQDLRIEKRKLEIAHDWLFARYEECAKERDFWKKRYEKGVKDERN